MKIKEYIENFTDGRPFTLEDVLIEIKELFVEIIKGNKNGISEEFQDVFHFIQLWFYWKFNINGEIWKISEGSVNKFKARKKVWQKLYKLVGLDENISNFCGNYNRKEKVIKQLASFGISKEISGKAFEIVVLKKKF